MIAKKLLVVVDYQRDFVDGSLGFEAAKLLEDPICERVSEYYANGGDVVFTMDTHEQKYLLTNEGKHLPVKHCIKGTPGWELYGETARACAEVNAPAIDKLVFGMDISDPAVAAVLPVEADEIELVGLVSNICVVSNAAVLQAKYPEARIVVDASLTASMDPVIHEKVLDVMEGFQVKVINR